jgi:hypothetical protein
LTTTYQTKNNLVYKIILMSTYPRRDYVTESTQATDIDYSISKTNIPSFRKILVLDDGKEISNKALNHAIYISNLSGAGIVILRVVGDVDKLGDTLTEVSQDGTTMKDNEKNLKRRRRGVSKCYGRKDQK